MKMKVHKIFFGLKMGLDVKQQVLKQVNGCFLCLLNVLGFIKLDYDGDEVPVLGVDDRNAQRQRFIPSINIRGKIVFGRVQKFISIECVVAVDIK